MAVFRSRDLPTPMRDWLSGAAYDDMLTVSQTLSMHLDKISYY